MQPHVGRPADRDPLQVLAVPAVPVGRHGGLGQPIVLVDPGAQAGPQAFLKLTGERPPCELMCRRPRQAARRPVLPFPKQQPEDGGHQQDGRYAFLGDHVGEVGDVLMAARPGEDHRGPGHEGEEFAEKRSLAEGRREQEAVGGGERAGMRLAPEQTARNDAVGRSNRLGNARRARRVEQGTRCSPPRPTAGLAARAPENVAVEVDADRFRGGP